VRRAARRRGGLPHCPAGCDDGLLSGVCRRRAAVAAVCMIMAQLLDEDFWTLILVFFVPFGDIFYFICNIWKYFTWFCVKYVGAAVCAGAALGLAAHSAH